MLRLIKDETCLGVEGLEKGLHVFTTDEIVKGEWEGIKELMELKEVGRKEGWGEVMEKVRGRVERRAGGAKR